MGKNLVGRVARWFALLSLSLLLTAYIGVDALAATDLANGVVDLSDSGTTPTLTGGTGGVNAAVVYGTATGATTLDTGVDLTASGTAGSALLLGASAAAGTEAALVLGAGKGLTINVTTNLATTAAAESATATLNLVDSDDANNHDLSGGITINLSADKSITGGTANGGDEPGGRGISITGGADADITAGAVTITLLGDGSDIVGGNGFGTGGGGAGIVLGSSTNSAVNAVTISVGNETADAQARVVGGNGSSAAGAASQLGGAAIVIAGDMEGFSITNYGYGADSSVGGIWGGNASAAAVAGAGKDGSDAIDIDGAVVTASNNATITNYGVISGGNAGSAHTAGQTVGTGGVGISIVDQAYAGATDANFTITNSSANAKILGGTAAASANGADGGNGGSAIFVDGDQTGTSTGKLTFVIDNGTGSAITGGNGVDGANIGGNGGNAIAFASNIDAATITNAGAITGGNGGNAGTTDGGGGDAIAFGGNVTSSVTITNSGTITGGNEGGTDGANVDGDGIDINGNGTYTITNTGNILAGNTGGATGAYSLAVGGAATVTIDNDSSMADGIGISAAATVSIDNDGTMTAGITSADSDGATVNVQGGTTVGAVTSAVTGAHAFTLNVGYTSDGTTAADDGTVGTVTFSDTGITGTAAVVNVSANGTTGNIVRESQGTGTLTINNSGTIGDVSTANTHVDAAVIALNLTGATMGSATLANAADTINITNVSGTSTADELATTGTVNVTITAGKLTSGDAATASVVDKLTLTDSGEFATTGAAAYTISDVVVDAAGDGVLTLGAAAGGNTATIGLSADTDIGKVVVSSLASGTNRINTGAAGTAYDVVIRDLDVNEDATLAQAKADGTVTVTDATVATGKTLTVDTLGAAATDFAFTTLNLNGTLVTTDSGDKVKIGTLSVAAGESATVNLSANADNVLDVDTTTATGNLTLTIDSAGIAADVVDLGNITLAGSELAIDGETVGGTAAIVDFDTLTTTTDTVVLTTNKTSNANKLVLNADNANSIYLTSDLIYNSNANSGLALYLNDGATMITQAAQGGVVNSASTGTLIDANVDNATVAAATNDVSTDTTLKTLTGTKTLTTSGSGTTVVLADTATTSGTVSVGSGSTLVSMIDYQASGTTNVDGTMKFVSGTNTIATLETTGTSGVIAGTNVTVTDLNTASGESIKLTGKMTVAGNTMGADNDGALVLSGSMENTAGYGQLVTSGAGTDDLGNITVASGAYGLITSGGATASVQNLDVQGHLTATADVTVNGTMTLSGNSYDFGATGLTLTVADGGKIVSQTGADGKVSVKGDTALGNIADTLDNQTTETDNTISVLDILARTDGGAGTAGLTIDNSAATAAVMTITTTNITANTTGGTSGLTLSETGTGSQALTFGTVNISGVSGATWAKLAIADCDQTVSVGTLNFTSTYGLVDNQDATDGAVSLTTVNIDASSAAKTGKISNYGATVGTIDINTINVTGDTSSNATYIGTIQLDNDNAGGTNAFDIETINFYGANAVGDAIVTLDDTLGTSTADVNNMVVGAGKYGTITETSGTLTLNNATVNGTLDVNTAATGWVLNGTDAVSVGSAGFLDVSGVATAVDLDASTATTKITVDLGTGTDGARATGTYAKVTGAVTVSEATAGTIDNLYVSNGVAGVTYDDVFTNALTTTGGAAANTETLQTEDAYRSYALAAGTSGSAIVVSANTSGINSAVTGNGGTAVASTAAKYLVENQASFDSEGFTYVQNMAQLSAPQFARAAEETIGEEATTQTAQNALMGVTASTTAVSNQMTSFRSGNIASGMASSFNSGGATAALSDMADAETLAEAYEAGFTSGSDCAVYKKVQVWANGFGGFGEQGTDGTMIGYDFWNIGTMVGLDYAFAKELRVGALFGYSYNKTDVNWNSGDSTDNLLRFGAYASYNWDNFFVDLSPTMGIHILESNRNIWNGATAKGDRTGVDFNISGTVGYTFNLPADIQLTPSYSLGYTMFYDPEFTETGAGAANVKYNSFTSNSLLQDLGVRLGKLIRTSDDLAFLPEVWGGWEVEYLNTGGNRNTTTASSIGSQTYGTTMNGMATNRGYWGAGMTALIKDNVSVFGRYDQKIWDKGYNVGFTAGVKVSF